jgi:hypothetical protein
MGGPDKLYNGQLTGLEVGRPAILDQGHRVSGVIMVRKLGRFFADVQDPKTGSEWSVMKNRLTPKTI